MKTMNKSILLVLGISLLSCGTSKKDKTDTAPKTPYTINTSYLDKSVSPTEDFYQFANGTWIANNPIPPSESRWGSFNELDKLNKAKLTEILNEALIADAEEGSNLQIIGEYYAAMKNTEARELNAAKKIEARKSVV